MLILSRVCAEFHDTYGNAIFSVTPVTRNSFVEAPDAIRQDPLFRMLLNDGSLEAAVPEERKKILEQDPAAGHDASGRRIDAASGGDAIDSEVTRNRKAPLEGTKQVIRIESNDPEAESKEKSAEKSEGNSDLKAGDKPVKAGRPAKAST